MIRIVSAFAKKSYVAATNNRTATNRREHAQAMLSAIRHPDLLNESNIHLKIVQSVRVIKFQKVWSDIDRFSQVHSFILFVLSREEIQVRNRFKRRLQARALNSKRVNLAVDFGSLSSR